MPASKDKFVFNSKASDNNIVAEMRNELKELMDMMDDLRYRVTINGTPIFDHFIRTMGPDVDMKEIKIFGRALVKYAEKQPRLQALKKQIDTIDSARANPDLIAMAFADASDVVDGFETLLKEQTT